MRVLKPSAFGLIVAASLILGHTNGGLIPAAYAMSTSTTLTSSANPSQPGQAVTLTARVSAYYWGISSGQVEFRDGSTLLGTARLRSGSASLTVSTLSPGTHPITARYLGFRSYTASTSPVLSQVVQGAAMSTSTSLTSSPNPSQAGQAVTIIARVSTSDGGTATGTVQFFDGYSSLGTAAMSGGSASLTTSSLTAGNHSLAAIYNGGNGYTGSTSAQITQVVQSGTVSTSTSLSTTPNPSQAGQAVTLGAQVTASNGSTVSGSVQFLDGSTSLGTVNLSGGVASITTASLAAGSHTLTAVYGGGSGYTGSTSPVVTQVVQSAAASTTTSLTSSPNPSHPGQAVTLVARVTASDGSTASGTVRFLDGSTSLGTVTLSGGTASMTTSSLSAGSHSLTAAYGGGDGCTSSTSPAMTQTVEKMATTTSVTSSENPIAAGEPVTFTATVAVQGGTPTGAVEFRDGSNVIGSASLAGGRGALTIDSLAAGTHSITASYGGDSMCATSVSAALTQTISSNPATTTTLTSSLNPSTVNQAVTFTAVVTASGTATGTVRFLDGSTSLGTATLSSGTATLLVSSLTAGTHSITAAYGGDSTHSASTSAAVSQEVNNHSASLSWAASVSPHILGYNVYRRGSTTGQYTKLNTDVVPGLSYTDTAVQSGQHYYYVCTAVDTNGAESSYSNQVQAIVP